MQSKRRTLNEFNCKFFAFIGRDFFDWILVTVFSNFISTRIFLMTWWDAWCKIYKPKSWKLKTKNENQMSIKKGKSSLTKIYGISVLTINRQFILFNSSCDIATKTNDAVVTINDKNEESSFQSLEKKVSI